MVAIPITQGLDFVHCSVIAHYVKEGIGLEMINTLDYDVHPR